MISVIFGTHNREQKLKKCLDSIANEAVSFDNKVEVLIADGGSTDGTLDLLRSNQYQFDIRFIAEGALHGVTRCYNRLFRMAKYPFVTWMSDDCRYEKGTLSALIDRIDKESSKTLVGCYVNNDDGLGWVEYTKQKACTVGGARKSLYESIDFWSEDYLTYASDIDFCCKLIRSGGKVVFEPRARVFHEMNHGDQLHKINNSENIASTRFDRIYQKRRFAETGKMYPDVFLIGDTAEVILNKLENARINISWCNFYCLSLVGEYQLLRSMNVQHVDKLNKEDYDLVL